MAGVTVRTVQQDCHGVFVRVGGQVVRPQAPAASSASSEHGRVTAGSSVSADADPDSGRAWVAGECWWSHGEGLNVSGRLVDSESRWLG